MIACFIETVALVILLAAQSMWQVYLFIIIFAIGYGSFPLDAAIVGEYWGRKNFATIRGIIALLWSIGIVAGPIYAGYIYDVAQSYQVVFITFIVAYFLSMIVFFFAKRPKPPARVADDAIH